MSRPAKSAATDWVNGVPAGVGTTSVAPGSGATAASARPQTSGFITMPAPPP